MFNLDVVLSGIDAIVRHISLSDLQIAGVAIVALAFMVMVMPDSWISVNLKKSSSRKVPVHNDKQNPELQELNPLKNSVSVER